MKHISNSLLVLLLASAAALPDQARDHFERGRALFEEHDDSGEAMKEAETEFRRALQLDPKLAAAVAYLGFIADDQQRREEAAAAYRKALDIDPRCAEARVGLARLHRLGNQIEESLRVLRLAVAEAPANRLALRELAWELTSENAKPTGEMWRESTRHLETLIALDPDDRGAHYDLAQAWRHLKQWPDAEREFREVLRIGQTPEDLDVWVYSVHFDVAEMLERQGRYLEAIAEYEALLASDGPGEEERRRANERIALLREKLRKERD